VYEKLKKTSAMNKTYCIRRRPINKNNITTIRSIVEPASYSKWYKYYIYNMLFYIRFLLLNIKASIRY